LPACPDSTLLYKFKPSTGGYDIATFIEGVGWDPPELAAITLNPGEGAFIKATAPFTATFVGEVQLTSHNPIAPNTSASHGFSIVSSAVPQQGGVDTDLKFAPVDSDLLYQFNHATGGYAIYTYIQDVGWDDGNGGSAS